MFIIFATIKFHYWQQMFDSLMYYYLTCFIQLEVEDIEKKKTCIEWSVTKHRSLFLKWLDINISQIFETTFHFF